MKAQQVRDLDEHELKHEVAAKWTSSCSVCSFRCRMGQTDGLKKMRDMKKDRARMLTILRRAGTGRRRRSK